MGLLFIEAFMKRYAYFILLLSFSAQAMDNNKQPYVQLQPTETQSIPAVQTMQSVQQQNISVNVQANRNKKVWTCWVLTCGAGIPVCCIPVQVPSGCNTCMKDCTNNQSEPYYGEDEWS